MTLSRKSAPSLFIVGWGRMGSAIGLQARAAGWKLAGAWSRHAASAARARNKGVSASHGRAPPPIGADLVVLAVADSAIADIAAWLAPALRPPTAVIHLSGSLDLAPLAALRRAGLPVGSLHPLCSVVGPESRLSGASCALEGDAAARKVASALAHSLGLHPLSRSPRDRPRYHLAAMLLASSSAALAGEAERLLLASGVARREAAPALAALLRSVADNLARRGVRGALTGPIARGDATVVRRHLALLRTDPTTLDLYQTLGRLSLQLAETSKLGDRAGRAEIATLLARGRR